ncbi:MAG: outer membrane lipoprotein carrier protein LolA [Sandaracinaceae bacterium]|nr:outer membrane lipoprotein carrier protein LolA [Sandaracinaceae bacterium]
MKKSPEATSMQLSMRRPLLALSLALCCVTLAGASPTSSQAQPAAPTLERLLAGFASMTGMSARFVEEKQIALLVRPIRSEGVLYFTAPGRLMRRVTSPTVSAALIEGDTLTFVGDGRREEIPISSNAVVGGFVSSFRHVLAGDRAALERAFTLRFEALGGQRWRLRLLPRNADLRRFLTEMELVGEGARVETMVMREASGDLTTTTFSEVDTARRFSAAETRDLFRL